MSCMCVACWCCFDTFLYHFFLVERQQYHVAARDALELEFLPFEQLFFLNFCDHTICIQWNAYLKLNKRIFSLFSASFFSAISLDFVCISWLHREHIFNALLLTTALSCMRSLWYIFCSFGVVQLHKNCIVRSLFSLQNDVHKSERGKKIATNKRIQWTMWKKNVKEPGNYKCALMQVPLRECRNTGERSIGEEKLDIFQVNSTKQEKCTRNNNHHDNIVLRSTINAHTTYASNVNKSVHLVVCV